MTVFPEEAFGTLGYYVYRLIDPRFGNTFYVGKGKEGTVNLSVDDK